MILDNAIVIFGTFFLIYIFVKSKKIVNEIDESKTNIRKLFLKVQER